MLNGVRSGRHDGRDERRLELQQHRDDPPGRDLYHHRAGRQTSRGMSALSRRPSTRRSRRSIRRPSPESAWRPPAPASSASSASARASSRCRSSGQPRRTTACRSISAAPYWARRTPTGRATGVSTMSPRRPRSPMGSTASPRSPSTRRGTSVRRRRRSSSRSAGARRRARLSTPREPSRVRRPPGSLVTIVDGDVVLGVVVANSSGNWQFTPTLSKGKHSIMAEATNSAGYTSLLSGALNLNV